MSKRSECVRRVASATALACLLAWGGCADPEAADQAQVNDPKQQLSPGATSDGDDVSRTVITGDSDAGSRDVTSGSESDPDIDVGRNSDSTGDDSTVDAGRNSDPGMDPDMGDMGGMDDPSMNGGGTGPAVDAGRVPTDDAGTGTGTTPTRHPDLGKGDGKDVITIGDSWMSNTLGTGDAISGALRRFTKQPYRNYAVQGVMLLAADLFGPAIPTQLDSAVRVNKDIKTVVMTGGGNDIIQSPGLQADCKSGGAQCKAKLQAIGAGLMKLWQKMADDHVQDVVYIGYSSDAGGSGSGTANANQNGMADLCAKAPLPCHLIDSTPLVKGELMPDGIHPTQAANDRMAKAIYQLMEDRGLRR